MRVEFRGSFTKDLIKIKSKSVRKQIKETIEAVEKAQSLQTIPNLKKLKGGRDYYRIKVGEYRCRLDYKR